MNPRHRGAVPEADGQYRAHCCAAAFADDDAHQVGVPAPRRHEVDEEDGGVCCFELRLQYQCIVAIPPRGHTGGRIRWRQKPSPVLGTAEESSETGIRVKTWPTKPVDRSAPPNESSGFTIAHKGIIFYTRRHITPLL